MKLYHATFQAYCLSIEEKGLIPGQQKTWENCESGFVYLAEDMDGAVSFCEAAEDVSDEIYNSGICCYEVELSALDLTLLRDDPNILDPQEEGERCYAYAGEIPFDKLQMCWKEAAVSKPSLSEQIESASARAAAVQPDSKVFAKDISIEL